MLCANSLCKIFYLYRFHFEMTFIPIMVVHSVSLSFLNIPHNTTFNIKTFKGAGHIKSERIAC